MMNPRDTYRAFAEFYDLYVGSFAEDLDFYESHCESSDRIIEIGCGTGRVLRHLLKLGYRLVGVDVSQEMLERAREKLSDWIDAGKLRLYLHDFSRERFNESFDRALVSFYTFNYVIDRPLEFLRNVYSSLDDHGMILMDLYYPNSLRDRTIDGVWIKKELVIDENPIKIRDRRHMADAVEHRQQVFLINNREIRIDTDRRYYSPKEMKGLLEKTGFKEITLSRGYDLYGFAGILDGSVLKTNYIVKATK